MSMTEEINRLCTDIISDILLHRRYCWRKSQEGGSNRGKDKVCGEYYDRYIAVSSGFCTQTTLA